MKAKKTKENFWLRRPLKITTKAADVKKLVDDHLRDNDIFWNMVSAVYPDGVPVIIGKKSGFSLLVKANESHNIATLCVMQGHVLATKKFPPIFTVVSKLIAECVSYAQGSTLVSR